MAKREKTKAEDLFFNFASTLDLSKHLANAKVSATFAKYILSSQKKDVSSDYSTESYEEADERLKQGDRQNVGKIQKILRTAVLKGSGTSTKTRSYVDVVGFAPHVPNFCANVPQTMINQRVVRYKNTKVLNVLYNASVDWTVSNQKICETASKVLSEIYSAEKRGYRINLYVAISSKSDSQYCTALLKIKSSEQYMDLLKVVYPMINPMFIRRHFFRLIETTEGLNSGFTHGYGGVVKSQSELMSKLPSGLKVDYYFDYYSVAKEGAKIK